MSFAKRSRTLKIWRFGCAQLCQSFALICLAEGFEALTALSHTGKTLRVAASEYLLAAGTLESTRLLLLADRQSNDSISRNCNALGRYFHDHLALTAAFLRPLNPTLTNLALSDRYTFGALRHLHFELRPEVQKASGIGSAYFNTSVELPEFFRLKQS